MNLFWHWCQNHTSDHLSYWSLPFVGIHNCLIMWHHTISVACYTQCVQCICTSLGYCVYHSRNVQVHTLTLLYALLPVIRWRIFWRTCQWMHLTSPHTWAAQCSAIYSSQMKPSGCCVCVHMDSWWEGQCDWDCLHELVSTLLGFVALLTGNSLYPVCVCVVVCILIVSNQCWGQAYAGSMTASIAGMAL